MPVDQKRAGEHQTDLPHIMPSVNDHKLHSIIRAIAMAPNLHLRCQALETCLKQVWALVPEEDEELFFDNIHMVITQARKWRDKN